MVVPGHLWWFGVMVGCWSRSAKVPYVGPG